MTSNETVSEWTHRLLINEAVVSERHIRLALQPRPRWLPERVWRRIIARLLIIEETQ